jgi:hypothetical protein
VAGVVDLEQPLTDEDRPQLEQRGVAVLPHAVEGRPHVEVGRQVVAAVLREAVVRPEEPGQRVGRPALLLALGRGGLLGDGRLGRLGVELDVGVRHVASARQRVGHAACDHEDDHGREGDQDLPPARHRARG